MNETVMARLRDMMYGSLYHYAIELRGDGEIEEADMLEVLAEKIKDGTATEEDWLEALDQVDVTEW